VKTKQLVVVRHGAHDEEHLTSEGKKVIGETGKQITRHIGTVGSIALLCSHINYVVESAEILALLLKTPFTVHQSLFFEGDHENDFERTMGIVEGHLEKVDTIIIVSHDRLTTLFPSYFARHAFDRFITTSGIIMGKGMILCENGAGQIYL